MLTKKNVPRHIAIIMDGNGRWAKERGLPRQAGHREGIKRVKEILRKSVDLGIEVVTLFAFSTENWKRPQKEINILMRSLANFLDQQLDELSRNNIKLVVIGRDEPLPDYIQEKLKKAVEKTKDNSGLVVVLALNYGSRQEIVDAALKFARLVKENTVQPEDLDVEKFSQLLYTAGISDPDLLIRTSGELRLSNFLLWQLSYAELYFPKKYWPDFKAVDLEKAVKIYRLRERRFGDTNVNQENN